MGESKNDLILKAIEVHQKYTEMLNQSDLLALQWLERVDKALRLGENGMAIEALSKAKEHLEIKEPIKESISNTVELIKKCLT
jgi:phage shock protein A